MRWRRWSRKATAKGLLFLGAGSVIHAVGGEQDMRKMGGQTGKVALTDTAPNLLNNEQMKAHYLGAHAHVREARERRRPGGQPDGSEGPSVT